MVKLMTEQPKPQPIRIPDAPLNAREHDMVDDMAEQIAITEALRWETIIAGLKRKIAEARARKAPPHIAENAQRIINALGVAHA